MIFFLHDVTLFILLVLQTKLLQVYNIPFAEARIFWKNKVNSLRPSDAYMRQ